MGLFDDALPGGDLAKPLLVAAGALLFGKLLSGRSAPDQTQPTALPPSGAPAGGQDQGGGQGFGGGQGMGGGLLGGLGGLLARLQQSGHADTAQSWVGPGPNTPIQPNQLGSALGQQTVSDLARQSGMTEQELLAQLSKVLPGLVDRMTPNGTLPTQSEYAAHANSFPGPWQRG